MKLHNHPELLERLAAEHALGTLRGGARRRLEHLARGDTVIQRALATWRTRIEAMVELVPGQTPPESVWLAIEAQLGLTLHRARAAQPPRRAAEPDGVRIRVERWFESLNFWRGWAIAATLATMLALAVALRPWLPSSVGTPGAAQIGYVAVLHDQSSQSTLLVTWDDAHSTMTVHKLANYPLRGDQALQLWGLPSQGHPVSLGVMKADASYSVQLTERPQNYPVLAVSVEPSGGSPNPDGPTGPVIYSGKLVPTT